MKKITSNLGVLVSFLIPVLAITIWIIGAFHGTKKHEVKPFDEAFGFIECWYYGAEYFWHEPNYDELNDNIKIGVLILETERNKLNASGQLELIVAKKDFKRILKKLDNDEIEYVKKGVLSYFNFIESFELDFLKNLRLTNRFIYKESSSTAEKVKECFKYDLKNEIQILRQTLKKSIYFLNKTKIYSLNEFQILKKDNYNVVELRSKTSLKALKNKQNILFAL